jgi:quinol-cytochrome oxidoreductase complex cytochrome b subunit
VYAILRSIDSKSGGILCVLIAFVILFRLPLLSRYYNNNINIYFFWDFLFLRFILSYCGGAILDYPFIGTSKIIISFFFFYLVFLLPI